MNISFTTKLLALALILLNWSLSTIGEEPINKLPSAWESIRKSEFTNSTRMARFVGYIEGAFKVNVPSWWRNDGATPFSSQKDSTENTLQFGMHPSDRIVLENDVFIASVNNTFANIGLQRQDAKGRTKWSVELNSLHPGFEAQGYVAIDCALVTDESNVYVFGRNGIIRFILVIAIDTGKKLGHVAFIDGAPLKRIAPETPPSETEK